MQSSSPSRGHCQVGHSRTNAKNARNEINQIADNLENAVWLPTLDTFRTFAGRSSLLTSSQSEAVPHGGRADPACAPCAHVRSLLTDKAVWNNIVITMRAVHVSIRQIGNSQGVVIPKPVLAQLGLDAKAGVEMTIEDDALVLRRPASPARTGWAEAARRIAEAGDDELVMGEFGNAEDAELVW